MKVTQDYIWDYDISEIDLKKPEILRWYLKRKIEHGDWAVLDRRTLKEHLPQLKINRYLKRILQRFLDDSK